MNPPDSPKICRADLDRLDGVLVADNREAIAAVLSKLNLGDFNRGSETGDLIEEGVKGQMRALYDRLESFFPNYDDYPLIRNLVHLQVGTDRDRVRVLMAVLQSIGSADTTAPEPVATPKPQSPVRMPSPVARLRPASDSARLENLSPNKRFNRILTALGILPYQIVFCILDPTSCPINAESAKILDSESVRKLAGLVIMEEAVDSDRFNGRVAYLLLPNGRRAGLYLNDGEIRLRMYDAPSI